MISFHLPWISTSDAGKISARIGAVVAPEMTGHWSKESIGGTPVALSVGSTPANLLKVAYLVVGMNAQVVVIKALHARCVCLTSHICELALRY